MPMHVVIVGCGRVGARLAVELVRDGHTVAVIDKLESAFKRLPKDWPGTKVLGAGFDRDRLEEAGATRAGALAAVTSGDNSNVLCARIARETYEISNVVARIYDPRRAEIYQRLGIPTVATVTWTTEQVLRRLFPERGAVEWADPSGRIRLVERSLPTAWCGRRLADLEAETGARVVAVTRGGVPQLGPADLIGQEGDILYIAVTFGARALLDEALAGPVGTEEEGGVRP
ncbi:MAG TPA: TrkA family potassium uptake protein [Acidimicrobiales bacterium]|nr:TrkA family potassium uptake protein [Acidimicrobiales bacterium]